MSVPTIMYHRAEGNRTDHGWGWTRVETEEEYSKRLASGWANNPLDLDKVIEPEDDTDIEPEKQQNVLQSVQGSATEMVEKLTVKKPGRPKRKA